VSRQLHHRQRHPHREAAANVDDIVRERIERERREQQAAAQPGRARSEAPDEARAARRDLGEFRPSDGRKPRCCP
jgi:hypothetical protein